jgi:hypothetical protein
MEFERLGQILPGQHKYGRPHRRVRAKFEALVASGAASCARCGKPIAPGEPWDLDHDDSDRRRYLGPSHRACNRAEPFRRLYRQAPGEAKVEKDRFDGLPDPDPENTVTHWSRHWAGGFNPRCPECRRLRAPCPDADLEAA